MPRRQSKTVRFRLSCRSRTGSMRPAMPRHFGVLIPSTNTTVELEYSRRLPPEWQAHYGRLRTSTPGMPFGPSRDEDIDYQSRLLGTAKVEIVVLVQTSASLFAEDYDVRTTKLM